MQLLKLLEYLPFLALCQSYTVLVVLLFVYFKVPCFNLPER